MSACTNLQARLQTQPHTWLVTGVAGFIGSNLLEALLKLNQRVVGLDNFATAHQRNLDEVQGLVTPLQWDNFQFIKGDICNLADCHSAMLWYNATNIIGFLNMLVAARDAKVKRFVYAASSSTYGDQPALPKMEDTIGKPLSPYAVTKYVNELYADVFAKTYDLQSMGLRYFNVFDPRQDSNGAYAAVIPKWILSMIKGEPVSINGDGETSRDFCFISNVVQANLLAATTENVAAVNQRGCAPQPGRYHQSRHPPGLRTHAAHRAKSISNPEPMNLESRPGMQLLVEVPGNLPDAAQRTPAEFVQEAKLAMAIKLFEIKRLTPRQWHSKAKQVSGLQLFENKTKHVIRQSVTRFSGRSLAG